MHTELLRENAMWFGCLCFLPWETFPVKLSLFPTPSPGRVGGPSLNTRRKHPNNNQSQLDTLSQYEATVVHVVDGHCSHHDPKDH